MAQTKQERLESALKRAKAKKFVIDYQEEHGTMPALSLVTASEELSSEDMANINFQLQVNNLVDMASDYSGGTIVVPGENVTEVDVPADTAIKTIKADFADEATVNFSTPKSVAIQNLGNNVIESLTVVAPAASANTTITVSANCGTITAVNANVTVPAPYTVENIILLTEEGETSNLTINANFAENASVSTDSSNPLTITNKNGEENLPNLNIDAENSTVTLNSQWGEIEASVSDNTLYINATAHVGKLMLNKGNAIVKVPRQSDIESIVEDYELAAGTSIDYMKVEITNANSSKLGGVGEMTLMENITRSASLTAPVSPAWNAVWVLNGKTLEVTGSPKYGIILNKYVSNLEVKGEGTLRCENSYGLWNESSMGGKIIINGGNIEAQTHAVYSSNGIIEINGGSFKLTNAATADRDGNGKLKFLINCLDASYQSGKANIIVKGGKFYEFDPADNESEGPHTNYVAAGYKSVESMEEGLKVYTVVKDE